MLQGVKRKYPQLDLDDVLDNAKSKSSYCPDMLHFNLSFGGHEAGRSIVKSALALAISSGIPAESCVEAVSYLKSEESEACFGYFYESDLIMNRPEGIPIHCVSIRGCRETQQLIGYVEYFGVQRMILCLSSTYKDEDLSNTYAINPITGKELNLVVELNFSNTEIFDAYDYKKFRMGLLMRHLEKYFLQE